MVNPLLKNCLIFLLIPLFLFSCKEKPITYDKITVFKMARKWQEEEWRKAGWKDSQFEKALKKDRRFELLMGKSLGENPCAIYGLNTGCIGGVRAKVRKVVILAVHFKTPDQAKKVAEAIDGWYIHNWVFDDVTGEPVLEDFVKAAYNAKKANPEKVKD